MGKNKIHRLLKEESVWKDKNVLKHKHEFDTECLICVHYGDMGMNYYHAIKCNYCGSFKSISEKNNISGLVINNDILYNGLPVYHYKTSHKMRIGFNNLDLVYVGEFF